MNSSIKFLSVPFIIVLSAFFLITSCLKESSTQRSNRRADVYKNLQYGTNKDINNAQVNLKLDVYVPAGADETQTFPMILYVHGGGFSEGDKEQASSLMQKFVDSGFVAVSIDYRLIPEDGNSPCTIDPQQTEYASYMAVQDTKAALRFMVANAAAYHVDVSKIFLAGNSAGAVTVLNTVYLSQNDYNDMIPGVETKLGSLDNSSNSLTNTYTIRGIAANSGCLPDPSYITALNVVPMILFHGEKDEVIPVDKGHTYGCENTAFVYGSESLYNKASGLETAVVAHIDPQGSHLPYNSNFLAINESCFFNSILSGTPESGYYTGNESSCR
jgi:acetyl esterase/lipase